jgi:RNA polymerase sigma factor (sigma-70 family)
VRALSFQQGRVDRSFERLYRKHRRDVYRYSLGVLANPADAEDVTQTAFLNAYRAFQRGDRPDRPVTWLIAIAHNICRQRFRQSARRPSEVALEFDVADAVVDDDDVPAPADLTAALGQLTFNQRSALVMRELEGRSYADIAEVLGLSLGAVETLIFRARRALREQLEGMLTCNEAERAISRQLDGTLERGEKGRLRAHLRVCPDCAVLARRLRAQRASLKSLVMVPLPASLNGLFGGGATGLAGLGGGLAVKAAAVAGVAVLASGTGYEVVTHASVHKGETAAAHVVATHVTPPASPAIAHARTSIALHLIPRTNRAAPPRMTHPRKPKSSKAPGVRPAVQAAAAGTVHATASHGHARAPVSAGPAGVRRGTEHHASEQHVSAHRAAAVSHRKSTAPARTVSRRKPAATGHAVARPASTRGTSAPRKQAGSSGNAPVTAQHPAAQSQKAGGASNASPQAPADPGSAAPASPPRH